MYQSCKHHPRLGGPDAPYKKEMQEETQRKIKENLESVLSKLPISKFKPGIDYAKIVAKQRGI